MKKVIGAMMLLLMGMAGAVQADQCESWTHKAYPVSMSACSYDNGGSGYVQITNDGPTAANVCWTVVFNDGRTTDGCYRSMPAGETTTPSCASCGFKNGGAKHVLLQKYAEVE